MIPSRTPNLVLVERKAISQSQWGDGVTWSALRLVWVSINPLRGREVYQGDEVETVVTHRIRGDFLELEGVTSEDRILYNDQHDYTVGAIPASTLVFDLLAVLPNYDGRDDTLIQANLHQKRYGDLVADIPQ